MVWPSGVRIDPWLLTFGPIRAMRPPVLEEFVVLVRTAPLWTTMSPYFPSGEIGLTGVNAGVPLLPAGIASPLKRNWASGLFRRPREIRLVLIGSDETVRVFTSTLLEPPKMTPLQLQHQKKE